MDKEEKRRRIAAEIQDTIYAYHVYPHMALVPDWFLRYWDLAEACCDYFEVPFDKPQISVTIFCPYVKVGTKIEDNGEAKTSKRSET